MKTTQHGQSQAKPAWLNKNKAAFFGMGVAKPQNYAIYNVCRLS